MVGKMSLKAQEPLPYFCNVANLGLFEVQKRKDAGYTIALKKTFEEFLRQQPLMLEVAEVFVKIQAVQAFRREIFFAQCANFKALADRLAKIQCRVMRLAAYVDAVQRGYIVCDEATDTVIAGVFHSLDELEHWLDENEGVPF